MSNSFYIAPIICPEFNLNTGAINKSAEIFKIGNSVLGEGEGGKGGGGGLVVAIILVQDFLGKHSRTHKFTDVETRNN